MPECFLHRNLGVIHSIRSRFNKGIKALNFIKKMNQFPLISILINNYNYARFLYESIDSALGQTYPHVEVIVVDDGSTDTSREIICEYGDTIVPVFKENGGQASAFNAGFKKSQGDIIVFLDSDDYFAKNKIESILDIFLRYEDIGWLFHPLQEVDVNREKLFTPSDKNESKSFFIDFRGNIIKGDMPTFLLPATTGLCFRRNLLESFFPVPSNLKISTDNFLRIASVYLTPGYILNEKLAVHRIHGNNAFERRQDTEIVRSKTNIRTAFYIRKKFPETKKFADRLCAHSAGKLFATTGEYEFLDLPELADYLEHFRKPFLDLKSIMRIFFNYCRVKFSGKRSTVNY